MKCKKILCFLSIGILLSGAFGSVLKAEAQEKTTAVTITFEEAAHPVAPPVNDGNGILPETQVVEVKRSGFASYLPNNKRLPVTGEAYDQTLSKLGWIALIAALLFYLAGNHRKEKEDGKL